MMNRTVASFIALLMMFLISSTSAQAQVARLNEVVSLKDGLKTMLQERGANSLKKLTINVDADAAAELREQGVSASGSYALYQGTDEQGSVVGTVLVINERGKEGPLQVLVAVDTEGEIYDVGFTIFGEDKGKPALSWAYLNQFMQKTSDDPFRIGADIDGVSGATWTSESVASAIHRGVALYTKFIMNA